MTTVAFPAEELAALTSGALRRHGADAASSEAAARAMLHASSLGVDSHGVRVLPHYCAALAGGRLKDAPELRFDRTGPASGMVDADDGLGHGAAYMAAARACDLAAASGIGAAGVRRSSHIDAAGAHALAGAEAGSVTLFFSNADPGVLLHEGREAFHGTNPIAAAAPAEGERPWLFDMATSAIPFNRVLLHRVLDCPLPTEVAVDQDGRPTIDAQAARTLLPLGGAAFGYKGAGLAGLVTILAALVTGCGADDELIAMLGEPLDRPRNLGQFAIAIGPGFFRGERFAAELARYRARLRAAPGVAGGRTRAPGDREWGVAAERARTGIPVDAETAAFLRRHGAAPGR
jgi:ureidoglycolate dehydrogenase (NAD+)